MAVEIDLKMSIEDAVALLNLVEEARPGHPQIDTLLRRLIRRLKDGIECETHLPGTGKMRSIH